MLNLIDICFRQNQDASEARHQTEADGEVGQGQVM
jgi:hypothetical protein